jgi:transcriptional regulator with XRE-family HTH domain
MIRERRLGLGLGVRETARLTAQSFIPSPIKSAVYISRLESGNSAEMPVDSVTIDKVWGLGAVLCINPFELFLRSRSREDLIPAIGRFQIRDTDECNFGNFVRSRRATLGLSMREAGLLAKPWDISVAYWSQMENDSRNCDSKISGEKLWGMAVALNVDPLLLYVLSRRVDSRYLSSASRDRLFS